MSKNTLITKHLAREYAAIWELSKSVPIRDKELRRLLTQKVSDAKRQARRFQKVDTLTRKLENFGNGGGWGLEKVKEFSRIIFDDKAPDATDLGKWLSVELEVVMPKKESEMQFVSFVRKSGYMKCVTIKDDGSIRTGEERGAYGREIVITFRFGEWDFVRAICDKLNAIGCKVNKSCGLHVHFDMRHLTSTRTLAIQAQRVAKVVPALKQILPASRQENDFCRTTINSLNGSGGSRNARYAFVNVQAYSKHKTLEIRGHSGTTDAEKIINWIRIIKTVMAKPNRETQSTIEAMTTKIKFDQDLVQYMFERREKFANPVPSRLDDVAQDNERFTIGPIVMREGEGPSVSVTVGSDSVDSFPYGRIMANPQSYVSANGSLTRADLERAATLMAQNISSSLEYAMVGGESVQMQMEPPMSSSTEYVVDWGRLSTSDTESIEVYEDGGISVEETMDDDMDDDGYF